MDHPCLSIDQLVAYINSHIKALTATPLPLLTEVPSIAQPSAYRRTSGKTTLYLNPDHSRYVLLEAGVRRSGIFSRKDTVNATLTCLSKYEFQYRLPKSNNEPLESAVEASLHFTFDSIARRECLTVPEEAQMVAGACSFLGIANLPREYMEWRLQQHAYDLHQTTTVFALELRQKVLLLERQFALLEKELGRPEYQPTELVRTLNYTRGVLKRLVE